MQREHELSEGLAAYALGVLNLAEVNELRAHLEQCAICSDELSAFEAVVRALPDVVSRRSPPPRLKRRLLAEVRRASRARPARPRGRLPISVGAPVARRAFALGAVLAALIVGGIGVASSGSGNGVRAYRATVTDSSGTAELRVSGGHGELVVNHLRPPAAGKIYEVWLQHANGQTQPTGALFGVAADGAGVVTVPDSLRRVVRIIVTQEPQGGSRVPTLPAVITAQLS